MSFTLGNIRKKGGGYENNTSNNTSRKGNSQHVFNIQRCCADYAYSNGDTFLK